MALNKIIIHSKIIIFFMFLLNFYHNSFSIDTLVAEGFIENSGNSSYGSQIYNKDSGNVIYEFKANRDTNATIKVSTTHKEGSNLKCRMILYKIRLNDTVKIVGAGRYSGQYTDISHEIQNIELKNDTTYLLVVTGTERNQIGKYYLSVIGYVSPVPLKFVSPIKILSKKDSTSQNQDTIYIEQDRSACLYTNIDLCYKNNQPRVEWLRIKKINNVNVTENLGRTYPYPYFFNVNSNTTGFYTAQMVDTSNNDTIFSSDTAYIKMDSVKTTRNNWFQKDFVIGSCHDPYFNGVASQDSLRLLDWLNAGFNFLYGCGDSIFNRDPEYVLSRTVAQNTSNSKKSLINCDIIDRNIHSSSGPNHSDTILKYLNINDYSETNRSTDERFAMNGYFIYDEPLHFKMSNLLSMMEEIGSRDPGKLVRFNFNQPHGNGTFYNNAVKTYINSPWAKVFSSTDYPLNVNGINHNVNANGDTLTYTGYISDNHFYRLKNYATAIKENGYKVNLWGWAYCAGWNGADQKSIIPYPTEMLMRYYAFGPITYGAKGIIWYVYDRNNPRYVYCPAKLGDTISDIYNNLSKINNEIKRLGPTLMKLKWLWSYHGSTIDPSSGESGLPHDLRSPVLSISDQNGSHTEDSSWSDDSLCIGVHRDENDTFLTVFNKSIFSDSVGDTAYEGYANISKIKINGLKYPLLFEKSTGKWKNLPREYKTTNDYIRFIIRTNPGDMNLIRLADGNCVPIVNLNLTEIGEASNIKAEADSNANEITLTGNSMVGGTSDNLIFAYKKYYNDFEVSVRLKNAVNSNQHIHRGGIMIRQSKEANSPMIYLCNFDSSSSNYAAIYYRETQGAVAVKRPQVNCPDITIPIYLKLKKVGSKVTAYTSFDGITYVEFEEVTFDADKVYVGLCADGSYNSSATFEKFKIRGINSMAPTKNILLRDTQ